MQGSRKTRGDVLGGYLDTTIYESSLPAERRGHYLIAERRVAIVGLAKMPPDSCPVMTTRSVWAILSPAFSPFRQG